MRLFLTHWLPFILYAALIFYVSSQPLPEVSGRIPNIDKIAHFMEYGLFAYLAYRALSKMNIKKHLVFITIIISVIYGFSDELHQLYVPGRLMSVSDFLFDSLGASAVVILKLKLQAPRNHADKIG